MIYASESSNSTLYSTAPSTGSHIPFQAEGPEILDAIMTLLCDPGPWEKPSRRVNFWKHISMRLVWYQMFSELQARISEKNVAGWCLISCCISADEEKKPKETMTHLCAYLSIYALCCGGIPSSGKDWKLSISFCRPLFRHTPVSWVRWWKLANTAKHVRV